MEFEDLTPNEKFENVEDVSFKAVRSPSDMSPAGKAEFEKAKSNLSIISPKSKLSLYDHLNAILRRVLRFGIEHPVDRLEEISLALKNEKRDQDEGDILEVTPTDEVLLNFIEEKREFYKLKFEASREEIRTADEEESASTAALEVEEDEEEAPPPTGLPDLPYSLHRFSLCGVGLSPVEGAELEIALKQLSDAHRFGDSARFWGRVFAVQGGGYYVAECPFKEGVARESFGWMPQVADEKKEEEEEDEEGEKKSDEDDEEKSVVDEEAEGSNETVAVKKIPPIPLPKPPKIKIVPPEQDGTGVNEKLYFVCTQIGKPWRCLPSLKPYQISDAKQIKKYFTGDLEAEVGGSPCFRGREAHYLRAQIARISASSFLAPEGYYQEPEEEVDDEEWGKFIKSESYEPKSVRDMLGDYLEAWVHGRPAILDQGRCKQLRPEDMDEEEEEEEEAEENEDETEDGSEDEIVEAMKEDEVPFLRTIAEDRALGQLQPWTIRLSSKLGSFTSILLVQSNLWPGSFTYYDGKAFDTIYIGFGHKYSVFCYAEIKPARFQKEYRVGSDLIEPEDSEVEPSVEDEDKLNEDDENADEDKDEDDENADEDKEEDD